MPISDSHFRSKDNIKLTISRTIPPSRNIVCSLKLGLSRVLTDLYYSSCTFPYALRLSVLVALAIIMGPPSHFLRLPRELRDTIYHHYVYEYDGYHFDYDSGKLRASSNRSIDLAFMYTCSLVAKEMRHLALQSNVINFFPLETESKNAACFEGYIMLIRRCKSAALAALKEPAFQHYKTSNLDTEVALKYPQFGPLLSMSDDKPWHHPSTELPFAHRGHCRQASSWGEASSVFRAFQDYMIYLLCRDTDFLETLANFYELHKFSSPGRLGWLSATGLDTDSRELAAFLRLTFHQPGPEPWSIPSKMEFAHIKKTMESLNLGRVDGYLIDEAGYWERVRWRL